MKTEDKTLKTKLCKLARAVICDKSLYGQLAGCHGFAALSTEKPEIYLPMAVLYAVLALRGH